jgi:hypothetical protein
VIGRNDGFIAKCEQNVYELGDEWHGEDGSPWELFAVTKAGRFDNVDDALYARRVVFRVTCAIDRDWPRKYAEYPYRLRRLYSSEYTFAEQQRERFRVHHTPKCCVPIAVQDFKRHWCSSFDFAESNAMLQSRLAKLSYQSAEVGCFSKFQTLISERQHSADKCALKNQARGKQWEPMVARRVLTQTAANHSDNGGHDIRKGIAPPKALKNVVISHPFENVIDMSDLILKGRTLSIGDADRPLMICDKPDKPAELAEPAAATAEVHRGTGGNVLYNMLARREQAFAELSDKPMTIFDRTKINEEIRLKYNKIVLENGVEYHRELAYLDAQVARRKVEGPLMLVGRDDKKIEFQPRLGNANFAMPLDAEAFIAKLQSEGFPDLSDPERKAQLTVSTDDVKDLELTGQSPTRT